MYKSIEAHINNYFTYEFRNDFHFGTTARKIVVDEGLPEEKHHLFGVYGAYTIKMIYLQYLFIKTQHFAPSYP